MNNKGFTLIELLITILLLAVILSIAVTGVIQALNASRNGEYKVLMNNIATGSKMFYEECEYGSLVGYKVCNDNKNVDGSYSIKISELVNYGLLTANKDNKIINPVNNKNIGECSISITYKDKKYTITSGGNDILDLNNKIECGD